LSPHNSDVGIYNTAQQDSNSLATRGAFPCSHTPDEGGGAGDGIFGVIEGSAPLIGIDRHSPVHLIFADEDGADAACRAHATDPSHLA
jgi:hypothetical protein